MARKDGCVWEHSGSCQREVTIVETRAEVKVNFPENTTSSECEDSISNSLNKTFSADMDLSVECQVGRIKNTEIRKIDSFKGV